MSEINNDNIVIPVRAYQAIMEKKLNLDDLGRLFVIICEAQTQKSTRLHLSKKKLYEIMQTSNRNTISNTLFGFEKLGFIYNLHKNARDIQFELPMDIFGGHEDMKHPTLDVQFIPQPYQLQFNKDSSLEMPPNKTVEKYNDLISELLADLSQATVLENLRQSEQLRDTYQTRVKNIRTKISLFEQRHKIKLSKETENLQSICRILKTVKVFDTETKTYEKANKKGISPVNIVKYFYSKISAKLGEQIYSEAWPSDVNCAKEILKQLDGKDEKFIRDYIDYVISLKKGRVLFYETRYHVVRYLQVIHDIKSWQSKWQAYTSRTPNSSNLIVPTGEEDLNCFFVHLYEQTYHEPYVPDHSYERDLQDLKRLKGYLNHKMDSVIKFMVWVMKIIMPAQKEKPGNPKALFRFLRDFDHGGSIDSSISSQDTEVQKNASRLEVILSRAAKREVFNLTDAEKKAVYKLLEIVPRTALTEQARQILEENMERCA